MRLEQYHGMLAHMDTPTIPWNEPVDRWDPVHERMVQGRRTKGYGDQDFPYAGKILEVSPWADNLPIHEIRVRLETFFDCEFYCVLCGLYEDETVGIPYHKDEYTNHDDLIVCVTFGATRPFMVRWNESGIEDEYTIEHGDVFVMDGGAQEFVQHSVPELHYPVGERVSLTFRTKGRISDE